MKGCVRGYGNYEELTTSGVDPTELFDDVEDSRKSPDFVQPDIVIEECDNVVEETDQQDIESPDHMYPLPIEKTGRHIGSEKLERNSRSGPSNNFDGLSTMPSLLSAHDNHESIRETKKVFT